MREVRGEMRGKKRESRDKGREGKRKYCGRESEKPRVTRCSIHGQRPIRVAVAALPLH